MTEVEYTEQALSHLEDLDPQAADRIMNKIDEATEWTELIRVEAVGDRRNVYDRHLPP